MHFMLNSGLANLSRIIGFHGLLDFPAPPPISPPTLTCVDLARLANPPP